MILRSSNTSTSCCSTNNSCSGCCHNGISRRNHMVRMPSSSSAAAAPLPLVVIPDVDEHEKGLRSSRSVVLWKPILMLLALLVMVSLAPPSAPLPRHAPSSPVRRVSKKKKKNNKRKTTTVKRARKKALQQNIMALPPLPNVLVVEEEGQQSSTKKGKTPTTATHAIFRALQNQQKVLPFQQQTSAGIPAKNNICIPNLSSSQKKKDPRHHQPRIAPNDWSHCSTDARYRLDSFPHGPQTFAQLYSLEYPSTRVILVLPPSDSPFGDDDVVVNEWTRVLPRSHILVLDQSKVLRNVGAAMERIATFLSHDIAPK